MDFKTWLKETYRLKESTIKRYACEAKVGTSHKWVNDKVIAFAAYQFPCNGLGAVEREALNKEIQDYINASNRAIKNNGGLKNWYKKRNDVIRINREKYTLGESYVFNVDDIFEEV